MGPTPAVQAAGIWLLLDLGCGCIDRHKFAPLLVLQYGGGDDETAVAVAANLGSHDAARFGSDGTAVLAGQSHADGGSVLGGSLATIGTASSARLSRLYIAPVDFLFFVS